MTGEKLTVALTYQATGFQDLAELSNELANDGQAADQGLEEAARKVDKLSPPPRPRAHARPMRSENGPPGKTWSPRANVDSEHEVSTLQK